MEQINEYQIIQKLKELNKGINLWCCENNEGIEFEVLTIKKDNGYERLLQRLIKQEVTPLSNREILGIQKSIETGFDDNEQCHFIVYERLEDYDIIKDNLDSVNVSSIKEITKGLDLLKKENRQVHIISPQNIYINDKGNAKLKFVGLFELFKQQGLLNIEYISPNVKAWLDDRKKPRPNFQDDIYALIKSFEKFFKGKSDNSSIQILKSALAENRQERFPKYHELLEELDSIPISKPVRDKTISINTQSEFKDKCNDLYQSMNLETWILVKNERSREGQVEAKFSTSNWSGVFYVNKNKTIFVDYNRCKNEKNESIITNPNSFVADFDFDPNKPSSFDCLQFFKTKFEEQNTLARLNKIHSKSVKSWKTLPDKEREYIEERAFKAKYEKRGSSQKNSSNVKFHLTHIEEQGWSRLKDLKNEGTVLFVNDQAIGTILDFVPKERCITIRDARCTIDEIPYRGELIEDVRQETSQYKKQVEACDKFNSADIVNPALCSILSTPQYSNIIHAKLIADEYENFRDSLFNKKLQNDESQYEAVLEALNQKPVYLIQGPPGTGKTTVIIELIQQILAKYRSPKILITSQSNLAVDNVLEKLNQISEQGNKLRFIRLASDLTIEKENISNDIVPHTFENKLKNWITKTEHKSKAYFEKKLTPKKDKELIKFYQFYSSLDSQHGWNDFLNRLRFKVDHIKNLFKDTKNLKEVENIFKRELGEDFLNLKNLQRDWFAFLGGALVDDGKDRKKSMLNNGSAEIDFLTAFLEKTDIIGATCIHIASSKYNKVNFKFDYVIMDESSKASPAETLVPINMGRSIVLIGDHKQLPPVVTREDAVRKKIKKELDDNGLDIDKEFGESLFEKLIQAFEEDPTKNFCYKMLNIQYRMPKQIGTLISNFFYDGKLANPSDKVISDYDEQKHHGLQFRKNTSIIFISTSKEKNPNDNDNKFKRQNKCNVSVVERTLSQLNHRFKDNLQKEKPFTIGIIAGYRGQVELLKNKLHLNDYKNFITEVEKNGQSREKRLIEINTVDKFQGAERDIIIYDIVRSSKGASNIGFLDDYRRINVAFSRAKRLLIIIGDSEYILKRAKLNPNGKFKEFKLRDITQELEKKDLIIHDLKDIII